jgi:dihydroxyacetone kinase-like protein
MVPGAALQKAGMTLVMKVGGAAGPLYGSLLMAMGRALPEAPAATDLALALAEGVEAVKKRGRSDVGEKTMLDVLAPVSETLNLAVVDAARVGELLDRVTAAARSGLASTEPMRATKGRASFLGDRSIGHLDPGARSSCLLVEAVCRCFEADDHD